MAAQAKQTNRSIAANRKARHDYFVIEAMEAGIELVGTEVKSLRIEDGELLLHGMHISPYEKGNIFNKDPLRPRRLLMHRKEIRRLAQQIKVEGYTLVPLSLYFKGSMVKVELGLCKDKKLYDKRAATAERDAKRAIDRAIKSQSR